MLPTDWEHTTTTHAIYDSVNLPQNGFFHQRASNYGVMEWKYHHKSPNQFPQQWTFDRGREDNQKEVNSC